MFQKKQLGDILMSRVNRLVSSPQQVERFSPEIIYKITNDTTKWTTAIGVGGNELWIIMN